MVKVWGVEFDNKNKETFLLSFAMNRDCMLKKSNIFFRIKINGRKREKKENTHQDT